MTDQKFWYVFCPGRSAPTVKHWTFGEAEAEAKRLAGCCPSDTFLVLEAVSAYKRMEPVTKTVFGFGPGDPFRYD